MPASVSVAPGPVELEAFAMPTDPGLALHHDQGVRPVVWSGGVLRRHRLPLLLSCSFKSAHISEILFTADRALVGN
jgi:hypothetical protein